MTAFERMKVRMQELGIEPKKSLGQNFLIADHVIEKIIAAAQKQKPQKLFEIGPGLGALTDLLKPLSSKYKLLELDSVFAQYWKNQGMDLWEGDALHAPWSYWIEEQTVLVSNLPYQISSSIVIDRSIDEKSLQAMVLMFQKEVAQRLMAQAKTEDYGLLTVIAQTFWQIEKVSEAGPRDFFPPPRVASRVLLFTQRPHKVVNKKKFLQFVKAAFSQRRKLMAKNLLQMGSIGDEQVKKAMKDVGLHDKVRSEELKVEQFTELFTQLGLNQ